MKRFFVETPHQMAMLKAEIKCGDIKENVINVLVKDSRQLQSLFWLLLQRNVAFERKPIGAGITSVFIDFTMTFFQEAKK